MTKYIIDITNDALMDLENIYHYIYSELQSPEAAKKQFNSIVKGIKTLDIFPERIKIFDLEFENFNQIRRLIVDNYSVFFVIEEDKVIVIRVLYSASDFSWHLKRL